MALPLVYKNIPSTLVPLQPMLKKNFKWYNGYRIILDIITGKIANIVFITLVLVGGEGKGVKGVNGGDRYFIQLIVSLY